MLLFYLSGKMKLKGNAEYVALSCLSMSYAWKIIKKSYKNNKFKISAPIWNNKFILPDRSHSLSDIQDYFENHI